MKLLLAHGSSDSAHGQTVEALAETVSMLLGEKVGVAYLSDTQIPADTTLLPLFLGRGVHVTEDAPKLAEQSGATLLPPLGDHADAITTLVTTNIAHKTIFLIYQPAGFEALQTLLQPFGEVACLHGEPSLPSLLETAARDSAITLQPLLLFPGKSLARVRKMIDQSGNDNITLSPTLCELDGFAELVADCFRKSV